LGDRPCLFRLARRGLRDFYFRLRLGLRLLLDDAEVTPNFLGNLFVYRARMRLLFCNAELRQQGQYYAVRLFAFAR